MQSSYSSAIQRSMSAAVLTTILLLVLIWFLLDYRNFKGEMEGLRQDYYRTQRQILVGQVDSAIDYIDFQRNITEKHLKRELKIRIDEAYSLVAYLYEKNHDRLSRPEIEQLIFDTLFAMRWKDGRGYYFAIDMQGKTRIHPKDPPGTDLYNVTDARGHHFVRGMIELAASTGEGYITYIWEKPPGSGVLSEKISFIRLFEPLNWFIGTGYYLDDAQEDTQEIIKERIHEIQYADGEGYIFIVTGKGISLVNRNDPESIGNVMTDLTDPNGVKIILGLITAGQQEGGGFVNYSFIKPATGEYAPKISYARCIEPWGWCVGTGLYIDDIESIISQREGALRTQFVLKGGITLLILIVLLLMAQFATRKLARRGLADFNLFTRFFKTASAHERTIDTSRLQFAEFEQMAVSANRMIKERKRIAAELESHRERLEERITARTNELQKKNDQLSDEIEERHRIEAALRMREAELRDIANNIPGAIYQFYARPGCEYGLYYVGGRAEELFGISSEAQNFFERFVACIPEEKRAAFITSIDEVVRTESPWTYETPFQKPDGETIWIRGISSPSRQGDEIVFNGVLLDVTDRRKIELELKKAKDYIDNIIESMPSILVGVDAGGLVTQWNRQAAAETGIKATAAKGRRLVEVFPRLANEMGKIETAIRERQPQHDPQKAHHREGKIRYEDVTIFPLIANGVDGAVIRVDDVTEQVRLEEMMVQSEKMLSVGGLAAGMAHEINNPLAGILQNSAVLENRLTGDLAANHRAAREAGTDMAIIQAYLDARGVIHMLQNITSSGRRAAKIVENMLSFARKSKAQVSRHDLGRLLDKTLELTSSDYDLKKRYDFKKIQIVREYAENIPAVFCETTEIQQVFLNVIKNGAEAMSEYRAALAADGRTAPEPRFILRVMPDGGMVRVEIEDNGPGMDESTRKRIFEPFFTTKPTGIGTGLGLSVSYFIITENHRGQMQVDSQKDKGTKFIIRLPTETRIQS